MTIKRFLLILISIAILSLPVYLLFNYRRPPVDRIISVYANGSSDSVKIYSGNYRYTTGVNSVELKNMNTGKYIHIKNAIVIIEDR